ncbi:MAG: hypothetical protein KBH07_09990 [Flavobacteriales bacterium]|nr:hypothetical protein [Flavobacteriales bacterium]MBP9079886.1 hypothetical protein [Flavobacteriales bacterium]
MEQITAKPAAIQRHPVICCIRYRFIDGNHQFMTRNWSIIGKTSNLGHEMANRRQGRRAEQSPPPLLPDIYQRGSRSAPPQFLPQLPQACPVHGVGFSQCLARF